MDEGEEKRHAGQVEHPGAPEGTFVARMLGQQAAQCDAQSHADIPRSEQRAVGRAALRLRSQIDEHGLEGGKHVTVAQAHDEGGGIHGPRRMDGGKQKIADKRDEHAVGGILYNAPLAQRACAVAIVQKHAHGPRHP